MKEAKRKKVLIVVAHPDDETIWMGGTIIRNKKNWGTTIISLCRRDDADRAPKFRRVCKMYGARCFMSDLDDQENGYFKNISTEDIKKRISGLIKHKRYDYIFTHGENGEYGHQRHKEVHRAVVEMLQQGDLSTEKLFLFNYCKEGERCSADKNSDKFINLRDVELVTKKNMIQIVYGFDGKSFEAECSKNFESFKIQLKI